MSTFAITPLAIRENHSAFGAAFQQASKAAADCDLECQARERALKAVPAQLVEDYKTAYREFYPVGKTFRIKYHEPLKAYRLKDIERHLADPTLNAETRAAYEELKSEAVNAAPGDMDPRSYFASAHNPAGTDPAAFLPEDEVTAYRSETQTVDGLEETYQLRGRNIYYMMLYAMLTLLAKDGAAVTRGKEFIYGKLAEYRAAALAPTKSN